MKLDSVHPIWARLKSSSEGRPLRLQREVLSPKTTLLARLAFKDVAHEGILSLCLVVSLAGLIAPLLVLFGLKYGVINKLQSELIEDPVNRELKPAETQLYSNDFFSQLRAMPEVEFVVQSVTQGASVIRVNNGTADTQLADMLPTADGDPLLLENATSIPNAQQVVLSSRLADTLNVMPNDRVTLSAQRIEGGDVVRADAQFTVSGVLPKRGDVLERAYVPQEFARDVESFREGFAVPQREWPGRNRSVVPAYHSLIFALDRALSASEENRLTVNSDFFLIREISADDFEKKLDVPAPLQMRLYQISIIDKLASALSQTRVSRRLEQFGAEVWLWNVPVDAAMLVDEHEWLPVTLKADGMFKPEGENADTSTNTSARFKASTSPSPDFGGYGVDADGSAQLSSVSFKVTVPDGTLSFVVGSVQLLEDHESEGALDVTGDKPVVRVHPGLLGQIAFAQHSPVSFNSDSGTFEREALGARGFRLFATSIYNVETLDQYLMSINVPTFSAIQAIARLQALDQGLTSLFLLIAAAGLITSVVVLIANQVSSVRRKRESLAQVRLLGLSKSEVSLMPVIAGVYLSVAGGITGIAIAVTTAWFINHFFAQSLGFDEAFCVIKPLHAVICLAAVLMLTAVSSLFAAASTTKVDPAEGMRFE